MQNQNFEAPRPLESDIQKIHKETLDRSTSQESAGLSERDLVRQSLRPMMQLKANIQTPSDAQAITDAGLPGYLSDATLDIKTRVEQLVEDAFRNGVEHAAVEAGKSGPFVVDALHDALSDHFYDELKRRNLI